MLSITFVCALAMASGLDVDPGTGETIPRGNPALEFDEVKDRAKRLREGMTRMQAQVMLGSPAEKSRRGDIWIDLQSGRR